MKKYFLTLMVAVGLLASCKQAEEKKVEVIEKETKVVSLSGTLTEILCVLGFESNIVGIDVTSTFPESVQKLPKVGYTRNVTAEGILSVGPQVVVAYEEEISAELKQQLTAAGTKVYLFPAPKNLDNAKTLIQTLADTLNVSDKAKAFIQDINDKATQIQTLEPKPKVLFIYARGAGMLMVAGDNTPMKSIIELAGGQNAVSGFEEFKPLSPEVLVDANPDVILIFDSGFSSLNGVEGLKAIPGMNKTNAAKNNAFIAMDGQYINGFGPRIGAAALELNTKLKEINTPKE
jgi:iron complex transport system substrate-binding protein